MKNKGKDEAEVLVQEQAQEKVNHKEKIKNAKRESERTFPGVDYEQTRRSKIVSRAVGRCAATSVDHLRCAAVLQRNT